MCGDIRSRARELLYEYKTHSGNQKFDHVFKEWAPYSLDSVPGGRYPGTSCTFPCHWMLWRLGCCEDGLVNRFDAGTSLRGHKVHFDVCRNRGWSGRGDGNLEDRRQFAVQKVFEQQCTEKPDTGDIVFIKHWPYDSGRTDNEHVLVFLDEVAMPPYALPAILQRGITPVALWLVAEAGGETLEINYRLLMTGPINRNEHAVGNPCGYLLGKNEAGGDPLPIYGWLPLDRLQSLRPLSRFPGTGTRCGEVGAQCRSARAAKASCWANGPPVIRTTATCITSSARAVRSSLQTPRDTHRFSGKGHGSSRELPSKSPGSLIAARSTGIIP